MIGINPLLATCPRCGAVERNLDEDGYQGIETLRCSTCVESIAVPTGMLHTKQGWTMIKFLPIKEGEHGLER